MRIPNLINQKLLSRSKHQILKTNLHGKVWQLQGRINNQILEVKGLKKKQKVQLSNIFHKRVEFWGKKKLNSNSQRPHLHLSSVYSFEKLQGPHQKHLTFFKSIVHSGTYSSHCPCSAFNKAPAWEFPSCYSITFIQNKLTSNRVFSVKLP